MKREVFVSGSGAVRAFSLDNGQDERRMPLECAGALCPTGKQVFCACGGMIAKLDARTLLPYTFFGGGPGVNHLVVSEDGKYLYALCSEADSVLMIDKRNGMPMRLNRAGVNPRRMALDGDMLAIAGGESGDVYLLSAATLDGHARLTMPGPVYDTAMDAGNIYALCLTASLDTMLVAVNRGGTRSLLSLSGMPGCLLVQRDRLLAAVEGTIYSVSLDGVHVYGTCAAPGRASWMTWMDGRLLLLDAYSEGLFCLEKGGWQLLCREASFAALGGA